MTNFNQVRKAANEYAYEVAEVQEVEVGVFVNPKYQTIKVIFTGCGSVIWYDEQCWQVLNGEEVYNCISMEEAFDVAIDSL